MPSMVLLLSTSWAKVSNAWNHHKQSISVRSQMFLRKESAIIDLDFLVACGLTYIAPYADAAEIAQCVLDEIRRV